MADNENASTTSTSINFETAFDMNNQLSQVSQALGDIPKAEGLAAFQTLKSVELCGSFPADFDKNIADLVTNINTIITSNNQYLEELKNGDEKLAGLFKDGEGDTEGGTEGKKPKGPGSGGSHHEPPTEKETEKQTEKETEKETENPGEDNYKQQVEKFKDMSLSDLSEVVSALKKLAKEKNTTIDELLSGEKYKDDIKKTLIALPNLSSDLKKLIQDGSSISCAKAITDLLKGKMTDAIGVEEDTSATMKVFLQKIAEKNNISLDTLISKDKYSKIVKDSLGSLKSVVEATKDYEEKNVQGKLMDVHDGSDVNLDATAEEFLRDEMSVINSSSGLTYQELLSDVGYAEDLIKAINRIQRIATYVDVLSSCSNELISSVLSAIIK